MAKLIDEQHTDKIFIRDLSKSAGLRPHVPIGIWRFCAVYWDFLCSQMWFYGFC